MSIDAILISIHALPAEGDIYILMRDGSMPGISIHALPAEGDLLFGKKFLGLFDFNPRPPRGGRHFNAVDATSSIVFQSTPSPRRATFQIVNRYEGIDPISIHALPAEGDLRPVCGSSFWRCHFNPRPPRGGRHAEYRVPRQLHRNFNPRPPRGGRQLLTNRKCSGIINFNPRPPRGGRQQKQLNFNLFFAHFREKFQSIGQKYPALNISIILFWCKNNKIQVRTSQHFLCAFASHQRIRTSSGK